MLCRTPAATLRPIAASKASSAAVAARIVAQPSTSSASHAATTTTSISAGRMLQHTRRTNMQCQASARPSVFLFGFGGGQQDDDDDEACTVMKLQVGVFGDVSKWQADLERLSTLYDTDDEGALHAIMQEVLASLLRRSEYISYASSGGRLFDSMEEAEAKFNEVSFEERSKMGDETLTNVNGLRRRDAPKAVSGSPKDLDQWLCITLVIAVERGIKLPKISALTDLKKAITMLAGIHEEELLAFELMWTPQDAGESYSKDELLMDFPKMVTLV